jgi:Kdo2-lipid IVA lauroyltransferase/acyltransferase
MSQKPTLRYRLEYLLFRTVEPALRLLPWRAALGLGKVLGRIAYAIDTRHRRVVRENLRLTDLNLTEAQARKISKACFAHFGAMLMTTAHMLHMESAELEQLVHFEGLNNWDAARSQNKGFIVLTGHYGCWEALALALSLKGRAFAVIGRRLDNPLLDPYLTALRSRWGNQVIPKAGAMRDALRVLKQGNGVGFVLDQDAHATGLFTQFLGQWVSTHSTAAVLAVKYGIPVLPLFGWPNEDGSISVRIDPPITMPQSENRERDVWVATQIMTRCIEDQIRQDPRWWFWMHRRFKTRPSEGTPLPTPLSPQEWTPSVSSTVNRG